MAKAEALDTVKPEESDQTHADLISRVIDAFTDDALRFAMEMVFDSLGGPGRLAVLIRAMEDHVTLFQDDEARDLLHACTRVDSPLSRQTGESMTPYVTRRKRWIQRLTSLDNSTDVSENILAGYLLGGASLNKDEQLMIRTVCGNHRVLEEIARSTSARKTEPEGGQDPQHVASSQQPRPPELQHQVRRRIFAEALSLLGGRRPRAVGRRRAGRAGKSGGVSALHVCHGKGVRVGQRLDRP